GRCADRGKRTDRVRKWRFCIAIPLPAVLRSARPGRPTAGLPPAGPSQSARVLAAVRQRQGRERRLRAPARSSPKPGRRLRGPGLQPPRAERACAQDAEPDAAEATQSARVAAPAEPRPSQAAVGDVPRRTTPGWPLPGSTERDGEASTADLTLSPEPRSRTHAS